MKIKKAVAFLSVLLAFGFSTSVYAQDDLRKEFLAYKKSMYKEFKIYKESLQLGYQNLEDLPPKKQKALKKKAVVRWKKFTPSTKKNWTTYSGAADSKIKTNFSGEGKDPGTIVIKTMVDIPKEFKRKRMPPSVQREMKNKGRKLLAAILKRIVAVKDPNTKKHVFNSQLTLPAAAGQARNKRPVSVNTFVKKLPSIIKKTMKMGSGVKLRTDGKQQKEFSIKVNLVPKHLQKRAAVYVRPVLKYAKEHKIHVSFVLGIMQTESYFNPYAKSSVAFGLLQLVPYSGAAESCKWLRRKKGREICTYGGKWYNRRTRKYMKVVTGKYLLNPTRNIQLGVAYLSKMVHSDLRRVNSLEKKYLLATSSYNTGHGNTAKGLKKIMSTRARYPRPAFKVIRVIANSLTEAQLYHRLHVYLPYAETRHYIKKVTARRKVFRPYDRLMRMQ
ncbi:MAG: membrane-bound lytic murein transglycosylase C [bacterium]|jgi:membrane-bound lytic murein transglycosylase C